MGEIITIKRGTFKVKYRFMNQWYLYGYAETENEAKELLSECAADGWLNRKVEQYNGEQWTELHWF